MTAKMAPVRGLDSSPKRGGNKKGSRRRFGNLRMLPSGRWQATFLGPDGVRHNAPVTFSTKGDATIWLDLQSAAITEQRWRPTVVQRVAAPPFREYAEAWLAVRELKPRTRSEYRNMLNRLEDRFGGVRLDAITPEVVRAWYRTLDPNTPTGRAHLYALLRTILGTAVEEELLDANPARIRGAGRSKRQHQIRPATPAELEALAAAMPERFSLAVLLSGWCALRFGELTELRRHDVVVSRNDEGTPIGGVIRVQRGVTWPNSTDAEGRRRAQPVVGPPKSEAGVRDVTIPPHLLPRVVEHLELYAERGGDGLLFPA